MIVDLTKKFPFPDDSCEYIYAEHLIEHFQWNKGNDFLIHCYFALKKDGILRLVLPDYKKIFKAYLENDHKFFESFMIDLNEGDLPYYSEVYQYPEEVLKKRKDNPPPEWHTSPRFRDRKKLALRLKWYKHHIEVVQWFTHQYGEHKTLYDFESLKYTLLNIGFSEVRQTERIEGLDSENINRIKSSLYIEAVK